MWNHGRAIKKAAYCLQIDDSRAYVLCFGRPRRGMDIRVDTARTGCRRMESLLDATSIEVTFGLRRAKWRMVPWLRKDLADKVPIPSNVIKSVIVVSTFDCSKELMRDEQTPMYKGDGTNNAGAIGPSIWGK